MGVLVFTLTDDVVTAVSPAFRAKSEAVPSSEE